MKIEISTKEYRELLDILHIADAVISGHHEEDKRTEPHHALIHKLYALAPGEGLEPVDYNESVNKYLSPNDFEQSNLAHALVHEFENHMFWDQLVFRLTERDAVQMAGGIDHFGAMNESDRHLLEERIRQRYVEEFSTNGVANLEIIEKFGTEGLPVQTSD